ncbi:DUF6896 domain-containing protein, partial [Rhizobium leguminosarum]|uniref:DUF6896 domain-containing protein n=1 Tax=Rhizobium leguminosarum TaxID=384 RepID=UPI003F963E68
MKHIYDLPDNPFKCQSLYPRSGSIETRVGYFKYNFHGIGCSFENGNLEVHYDYNIVADNYLTTSPWKFWRFI